MQRKILSHSLSSSLRSVNACVILQHIYRQVWDITHRCRSMWANASLHSTFGSSVHASAALSSDLDPATIAWRKITCSECKMKLEGLWIFCILCSHVSVFQCGFKKNAWRNGWYLGEGGNADYSPAGLRLRLQPAQQYWRREREDNGGKRIQRETECSIQREAEQYNMQRAASTEKGDKEYNETECMGERMIYIIPLLC